MVVFFWGIHIVFLVTVSFVYAFLFRCLWKQFPSHFWKCAPRDQWRVGYVSGTVGLRMTPSWACFIFSILSRGVVRSCWLMCSQLQPLSLQVSQMPWMSPLWLYTPPAQFHNHTEHACISQHKCGALLNGPPQNSWNVEPLKSYPVLTQIPSNKPYPHTVTRVWEDTGLLQSESRYCFSCLV